MAIVYDISMLLPLWAAVIHEPSFWFGLALIAIALIASPLAHRANAKAKIRRNREAAKDPTALGKRLELEACPLMNKSEYRLFRKLERRVAETMPDLRLFPRTCLADFLMPHQTANLEDAHACENRLNFSHVDFLLVNAHGMPVAALDYSGSVRQKPEQELDSKPKAVFLQHAGIPFAEIPARYDVHLLDDLLEEILPGAGFRHDDNIFMSTPGIRLAASG